MIPVSAQKGFSIIEWMISILIGLFITAGVTSLFVAGQRNSDDTYQFGELQEQGRLALDFLSRDLRHIGFFGDFTGNVMKSGSALIVPAQPAKQCLDDKSLPTFPTSSGEFRPVWAMRVGSTGTVSDMSCIVDTDSDTSLVPNSGVISIRRVMGEPIECTDASSGRYYLAANSSNAEIVMGADISSGCSSLESSISNMRVWEYQHHVYYLDRLSNGDGTYMPQLRKMELKVHALGNGMYRDSGAMVQGVEDMQFMFGIDTSADGVVDKFIPLTSVCDGDWDQMRVVAVQLFLLIRAREPSQPPYQNSATYQLGDRSVTVNDRYKRFLMSAIVPLRNMVLFNEG